MAIIHLSNGDVLSASLFVHKAISAPESAPWRLLWAESPDSERYIHAEGECSAKCFRTIKEAVAYGEQQYGETARRFKDY